MPKLLSPVKSLDGAVRVIRAGADEIYCGVRKPEIKGFSIYRGTYADIPSYDELGKIVKYAHNHGISVQLTVNMPFMTDVMDNVFRKHIRLCLDEGVDALIIGDMGILSLVKEMNVDIPLIASSYNEATNYGAVDFLEKKGFKRVILERQLRISEISEIVKHSNIEIEIMVHGAGCSNINGNCYLYHYSFPAMRQAYSETIDSSYVLACPCRVVFDVYDMANEKEIIRAVPILDAYTYCSICKIPLLVETGVTGFKIVGRETNEVYQERTTRVYRELLDLIKKGQLSAFQNKIEYLKNNLMPIPPSLVNLQEIFCEYGRCYYGSFFNAPYTRAPSWKIWTKDRFRKMVFERESVNSS